MEPDSPERAAKEKELLEQLKRLKEAPGAEGDVALKDAAFVTLESSVPPRLGKWQIVPPEAEKAKEE